jgi:hypothetical protein
MKKIYLILAVFSSICGFSQQQDAWVYFNSKADVDFYLANPLEMLTQRSIDRRTAQGIALDFMDVPIDQANVDLVAAATGITVMAKSKWLNAVHVRGSQTDINALSTLSCVDSIDFADDSLDASSGRHGAPIAHTSAPANRQMSTQIEFPYGNSANQIQMLNGQLLHQADYTGAGKMIAVLDAGFPGVDTAQPFQRLWNNNLILGGYNYVDGNDQVFTGNSHGTLVLSTMGGYTQDQLVGTAPDSSYYLFITEDTSSENPVEESYWVEAAEKADSLGVDVINSSLGYFDYDNPGYSYTYADMTGTKSFISRGADIAFTRGMVVVVSAGNSGGTASPNIGVPADGIHVLTVGAVTSAGDYASFSSVGPSADGRVKPDVAAQGSNAVVSTTEGVISTASGTSFSSPIIAGMVATFWSAVPTLTNQQVIDFVRQSADIYANPDTQKGYGIPDFELALNNALGVPDAVVPQQAVLYPNPVSENFNVALPATISSGELTVYNALGQLIFDKKLEVQISTIDAGSLACGVYSYKISSKKGARTGKLIKS